MPSESFMVELLVTQENAEKLSLEKHFCNFAASKTKKRQKKLREDLSPLNN